MEWLLAIWLICILPAGLTAAFSKSLKQIDEDDSLWLGMVATIGVSWPIFLFFYLFFLGINRGYDLWRKRKADKASTFIVGAMKK